MSKLLLLLLLAIALFAIVDPSVTQTASTRTNGTTVNSAAAGLPCFSFSVVARPLGAHDGSRWINPPRVNECVSPAPLDASECSPSAARSSCLASVCRWSRSLSAPRRCRGGRAELRRSTASQQSLFARSDISRQRRMQTARLSASLTIPIAIGTASLWLSLEHSSPGSAGLHGVRAPG